VLNAAEHSQAEEPMHDRETRPEEKTFDPEMTEGDEANAPEGTPAETGRDENDEELGKLAEDHGIPRDPQRPT